MKAFRGNRMEDHNKGMSSHCLGIITYGILSVQFTAEGEQTYTTKKCSLKFADAVRMSVTINMYVSF